MYLMDGANNHLLGPDLLKRLEQFQLLARRRSRSSLRGERRSHARGHSVEFADHRPYAPGDDLRYLDWNLYGRLDRLFLKLYEEERELPVTIFLDASESMSFGEPAKFLFARQVAAAMGHVALCGFDRVSVRVIPSSPTPPHVQMALRLIRGRSSSPAFFSHLSQLEAGGTARLNEELRQGALESRQTGLAVILSDFLDPEGYENGLNALLGRGFQVSIVQILSPEELNPNIFGDLKLVDSETGAEQEVTFARYRLPVYRKMVNAFCVRLKEHCQARGIHYFLSSSADSLADLLLRQLREAEIWS